MKAVFRGAGPVAGLLLLHTVAHFLPPERASVGADDYTYLVRFGSSGMDQILSQLATERQRPLQLLALALQARLVGGGSMAAFMLPYLSSSLMVLSAYVLLRALLQDRPTALAGAALFSLLPQTAEVYHTALYFNVNVALSLWMLGAATFLAYLRTGGVSRLMAALALYVIPLFWYEAGFFVPLVFFVWGLFHGSERRNHVALFLPITVLYFVYGHTSLLGTAPGAYGHTIGWNWKPLLHLLSFLAGPHLLRNVGYGLFNFPRIDGVWLVTLITLDAVIVYAFWRWSRERTWHVGPRALELGGVLAGGFLLPFALQAQGGIAGRHLVVPSVALVLLGLAFLVKRSPRSRSLPAVALACGLVVAQGNAWAQVVACRINRAVFDALSMRREALRDSRHVVIDLESFTRRIPYTWYRVEFDLLNSYYGAQTFEDWGLLMMTRLAAGDPGKGVHLAVTSPLRVGDNLHFMEGYSTGTRSFRSEPTIIPQNGAVVVGFAEAFGHEFRDGLGSLR